MRNVLYLRRTSEHQKESKGHKVIEGCEAVPFFPMPVSLTGKSENLPIFQATLYNQILSASLLKDVNCIALKCCVIFPFFSVFRSLKSFPRLNYSSTVRFEASQAEFGKPSAVQPACITRHRIKRSPCI